MTLENENDEGLMARVRRGDHQAFSFLVQRHSSRFYAVAYRMLNNSAEAEDVVQDSFIKLWNKPDLWNEKKNAKFTTWFYRVVTNAAIDKSRRYVKVVSGEKIFEHMADTRANAETQMYENETQRSLEEAIQALPDRQRAALNLCFYEEMSNKEAADILGVNLKALESLLMRAKAGVKDYLMKKGLVQEQLLKGAQG
jgi:RNA polymerase sigma-70 factor (ECF subfamily)